MAFSDALAARLRDFAAEREWQQFHTPRNLVLALVGEVGELAEIFQWMPDDHANRMMTDQHTADRVREELADVLSYLLRLADVLNVDLEAALLEKIEVNRLKYPVELSRGNSVKYTDFEASP